MSFPFHSNKAFLEQLNSPRLVTEDSTMEIVLDSNLGSKMNQQFTDMTWIFNVSKLCSAITVAAQSKAWTVFARSNAGIVGSNPTLGIDDCIVCIYSVCR
jgi:hypothetical protein